MTKVRLYRYAFLIFSIIFLTCFEGFNLNDFYHFGSNFNSRELPQELPVKGFTNSIHNAAPNYPVSFERSKIISMMEKELHFNATVTYDPPKGSLLYGQVGADLTKDQIENTNKLIDSLSKHSINLLMQRAKIEKLCYGQRCVYEVTQPGYNYSGSLPNDGFAFRDTKGEFIQDGIVTALHLNPLQNSAGYIAENIYENMQHTDFRNFLGYSTDLGNWHLKPSLKINTIDANNPLIQENIVVEIRVISFTGNLIKTIPIRVKDFNINNGSYPGGYINDFNIAKLLEISGTDLAGNMNYNEILKWDNECNVDFKIFWNGKTEVWFNKLTVDDNVADSLFKGYFDKDILNEANAADGNGTPAKLNDNFIYSIDELTYSDIPCIEYVQAKYKEGRINQSELKINFAPNQWMYDKGLKRNDAGMTSFMNRIQPKIFNIDIHVVPFAYPENLRLNGTISASSIILQNDIKPLSFLKYNEELQLEMGSEKAKNPQFNWGSYVNQISTFRESAKNNIQQDFHFVIQPQLQSNMTLVEDGGDHVLKWTNTREPTNEEIQMQAMLAIAHGADGLDWFWMLSLNEDFKDPNQAVVYGLVSIDFSNDVFLKPRNSNIFGQDKFNYVASMNLKIMNWKPWLDKIKWTDGYSLHAESDKAFSKYISNIKSIKAVYDNGFKFVNEADLLKERYWEIGYFQPKERSSDDLDKYFLLANRRCVPTNGNTPDGLRAVQIKFNKDELIGAVNWKLTDLNTGASVTFNKNNTDNSGYIDLGTAINALGYFNPGEGKLFRLTPIL
ncbi:hypothetical protein BH10BAC5_BH10BAC5_01160 [soil metagenome]